MARVGYQAAAARGVRRRRAPSLVARRALWAYLFLAPNLLFVVVFAFIPIIASLYISFHHWSMLRPPTWAGLTNYQDLFRDSVFIRSVWNTLYFLGATVPSRLVLGLGIALLLNQKLPLRNLLRTVTFLPWICSGVVVASLWLWILDPDYGIVNVLLGRFGLPGGYWYTDPVQAMPSIIVTAIWRSVGWVVIIYLAALQGVPQEYYEAAQIDGAGSWARFRFVTWPLLRPATVFVLVTTMIGSFQMFDLVLVMTNGGPINATTVIAYQIYVNGFSYLKMGYASAQAYVLFALIMLLSLGSLRLFRSDPAQG